MTAGAVAETWDQWTARIATELAGLDEDGWLTLTPGVPGSTDGSRTSTSYAANPLGRKGGWRTRRSSSKKGVERVPLADVFLQARRLGDTLTLECISDTEFEGLSDLSPHQQMGLVDLGWEQDGHGPDFHLTFPVRLCAGTDAGTASTPATPEPHASAHRAARLLRDSLERVLGATSPDEVVPRHSAGGA
jgi:hypothetical protein